MRDVFVVRPLGHLHPGQQDERAEPLPVPGQDRHVEVGEWEDQLDPVLGDRGGEGRDVAGILDARREEVPAGGVQRGRERIHVGRDGLGAGTPEGADDVDALTRAREQDGSHDCRQPPVSPR